MKRKTDIEWDVIVIGGGPGGMMAAGRAGEKGKRVLLLEKNTILGKKLLITGGGRCNVTNAELDTRVLLSKFKKAKDFLFSPFSQFGVKDTFHFFHSRNMPTKEEAEKRIFPKSDSAKSVWETLVFYMRESGVTIRHNATVTGFVIRDGHIDGVTLKGGDILKAHSYILATGGTSHPETGSTGEGFEWLKKIGHTVTVGTSALVPLRAEEEWVRHISGASFKDARVSVFQNGKRELTARGKILFTHTGLSGPLALNMSKDIGEMLKYGKVPLEIDIYPSLDDGTLDRNLRNTLDKNKNKKIKNVLGEYAPPKIAPLVIHLADINPEKEVNALTREERIRIVKILKHLPLTITGLLGKDKAVVTSGGIALKEIDWRTMKSLKYPELFLVGDVLDIDRPSGGYSLQLCWTTGFVAGNNAGEKLLESDSSAIELKI